MTLLRIAGSAALLAALALAPQARAEPHAAPDVAAPVAASDRVEALTAALAAAVDAAYRDTRGQRFEGASRLAFQLKRLRVRTRRLHVEFRDERSPEQALRQLGTIRMLLRDVAEELSEGFASRELAGLALRLQGQVGEIETALGEPDTRLLALGGGP